MNALTVQSLSKKYPNFELKDISFSLPQGKIMGFIGKNGAGKTTTLKSILNLVCPDSGKITVFDKDFIESEAACKQDIGVVLGGVDFYQNKKISSITEVTKRFYKNFDEKSYEKYIEMFELSANKRVKELSSGMKVKYMIALALSHNARLLILDEPTSGLDPVARDDILSLFKSIVADNQRSILFSTHITTDLEKCADNITYIKDGKLLRTDEKSSFIEHFQYLKKADEAKQLSLEEIMIRLERKSYNV